MSQFSAQNVKVQLNGAEIFATNVSVEQTKSTEPVRTLGNFLSQGQIPSGPVETTLSIDYLLKDGADPFKTISDGIISGPLNYAKAGTAGISVAGAGFSKMYMTSHSVTAEADGLVQGSVSFVNFAKDGPSLPTSAQGVSSQAQAYSFAHGFASTAQGTSQAVGFNYECSFEWEPVLLMGKQGAPDDAGLLFNGGSQSLTVRGLGAAKQVTFCPKTETASATATALSCTSAGSTNYQVQGGDITAGGFSAQTDGFQEGSFTVTKLL
jgi:hypothetical protein